MEEDRSSISPFEDPGEMSTASLSEVLESRSEGLTEDEIWALCRECCLTLEYVHDCPDLFQTLAINPDTVAFDPEGNVCFLDLDMEQEQEFVAPESIHGENSYQSHLYSLGMTLLFATECNNNSPSGSLELSKVLAELLSDLTSSDCKSRPRLDDVISACEAALAGKSSQTVCLKIIGLNEPVEEKRIERDFSSLEQMTDELSAYLHSQSTLVPSQTSNSSASESERKVSNCSIESNQISKSKDHNIQLVRKINENIEDKEDCMDLAPFSTTISEASGDEDETNLVGDGMEGQTQRRSGRKRGIMLRTLISSLRRAISEPEVWSICRESVLCLQRKKKHLPAYISPDTLMLCDNGQVTFRAIPEDKPLEIKYMAPELQAKGILNEKTCLYGLGVTLHDTAIENNPKALSAPDAEALEILLHSFLHTSADKRPPFTTALQMCCEYEKVQGTKSLDLCLQLYQEGFSKINEASSEEKSSSEQELASLKSVPNERDVVNKHLQTKETSTSFRPVATSDNNSAFIPVPAKPTSEKELYRVPSAFSSPATHFKPIVVQDLLKNIENRPANNSFLSTLVTEPQTIDEKPAVIRDRINTLNENDSNLSKRYVDGTINSEISDIKSCLEQMRNQGGVPDEDSLARSIAKYLKYELSGNLKDVKSNDAKNTSDSSLQQNLSSNQFTTANSNFSTAVTPSSTNSNNMAPFVTNGNNASLNTTSTTPNLQPISISSMSNSPGFVQPFPNVLPFQTQNNPPISYHQLQSYPNMPTFSILHDPKSGNMQMVPIPYFTVPFTGPMQSMSNGSNAPQYNYHNANIPEQSNASREDQRIKTSSEKESESRNTSNNLRTVQRVRHDSDSSSPSPSKDSGICLAQQGTSQYSNDSLMDKLLKSGQTERHKSVSRVIHVLRKEQMEDTLFHSGVDQLVLADYIASLTSLSKDTFSRAVREQYCSIEWSDNVLLSLHSVVATGTRERLDDKQTTKQVFDRSREKSLQRPESTNETKTDLSYRQRPKENSSSQLNSSKTLRNWNYRPKSETGMFKNEKLQSNQDFSNSVSESRQHNPSLNKSKSSSLHNLSFSGEFLTSEKHNDIQTNNKHAVKNIKDFNNYSSPKSPDLLSNNSLKQIGGNRSKDTSSLVPNKMLVSPPSQFKDNKDGESLMRESNSSLTCVSPLRPSGKSNDSPRNDHEIQLKSPSYSPFPKKSNVDGTHNMHIPKYKQGHSEFQQSLPSKTKISQNIQAHNSIYSGNSHSKSISPPGNTFSKRNGQSQYSGNSIKVGNSPYRPRNTPDLNSKKNPSQQSKQFSSPGFPYQNEERFDALQSSEEMRRLTAQKPELFDYKRIVGYTTSLDRRQKTKSPNTYGNLQRPLSTYENVDGNLEQNNGYLNYGHNYQTHSNRHRDNTEAFNSRENPSSKNEASNPKYGRSMSAIYNQPQAKCLFEVGSSNSLTSSSHHKRSESIGSSNLPEINSALLPYSKLGQIVYHSAMIQLSLTQEVNAFIHSIDEENQRDIEARLSSIKQEIAIQKKQRKKTQKFYSKLVQQGGDQNVSEQMLRDMADMTRKLDFLRLCQTHLQMLLAELSGLEVEHLYSLSLHEQGTPLSLVSRDENPYLQFRTFNSEAAGAMSVLQAGTPKGLMTYLYTSSALSDGYIHQFLFCFRYFLTSEQLLSFLLDKFRCAIRGAQQDIKLKKVVRRSLDLLQVWIEGYYSIDFNNNSRLVHQLADFLKEQTLSNIEGIENIHSLYSACRLGEHVELMITTEADDDDEEEESYFLHLANPKRWESFRSLVKRRKTNKSPIPRTGSWKSRSTESRLGKSTSTHSFGTPLAFSLEDCAPHVLAEQLTLIEQEVFRRCHPVHFLNSQTQGVDVSMSLPGTRTPSMTRKNENTQNSKRGFFVGDPIIRSKLVAMVTHSQELAHWVGLEILSCGSSKSQLGVVCKFLTVANLCLEVRNYATAMSIHEGLSNLMVKQLPVWKNIPPKYLSYLDKLASIKMNLKGENQWLMKEKDCHIYPTIPSALFMALHLQQLEIGGFTLVTGMYRWDKIRTISEALDQIRIFRDHEYGFERETDVQRALKHRLCEASEQDLHTVASTQENNFTRVSSSSSLSGTLKKVKEKLHLKKK